MKLCHWQMKVFKYEINFYLSKISLSLYNIFKANTKDENVDKNDKIRQKVSKLLIAQEECASKLLKIFSKKLDDLQTADRELATIRNL